MGNADSARQKRRIRSRLLLVLCFAALLVVIWLAYASSSGPRIPHQELAGGPLVIDRVSFLHKDVGGYHNQGPTGQPAWWISRDPKLVQQYGFGNDGVVLVRCNCGLTIRMLGQVISEDGLVTPSIWHDVPECGFHVYGKFEGWDNGRWDTQGKQSD
jgi:hypothetical protein